VSRPKRFERVRRVRQIEQELAREEFLSCAQVARRAEQAAEAMRAEVERAQRELTETRVRRRVPPHELLTAQTLLESLDATLREQRRRAGELRRAAEDLRGAWERARAEERTLERLLEHERAARESLERQAEARALDELAQRPSAGGGPRSPEQPAPEAFPAVSNRETGGRGPSSPPAPAADEDSPREGSAR
jgi:flagellar export protein FliJ